MNWNRMSRLLEAIENESPTRIVKALADELEEMSVTENKKLFLEILDKDSLPANSMALVKAKKWLAKSFDVHTDEIDAMLFAHDDLGEALYYWYTSAESQETYSLLSVKTLLTKNYGKIESDEFESFKNAVLGMSALEGKWFLKYLLRKPRNGINRGLVVKALAKAYDKKLGVVKKHLATCTIGNVLLYYEMGEEPLPNLEHGSFVAPMLAKDVPMNKWPSNKIVDYKYDGNRYQIHIDDGNVIIFNRKGKIVTRQFPDVVETVESYVLKNAILDGEIYPINQDGSPAEHKLMGTRVHSKNVQEAMERVTIKWVIFDCMKINDDIILNLPYSERLEKFSHLPDQAHRMEEGGDVLAFYNRAINDGFEGIIVKDASLPYEPAKRSAGWAKYKPPRIELDVVILSAKYGQGSKANVFATFEMGVDTDTGFMSVGWVGTGFSDAELLRLTNSLRKIVVDYNEDTYSFSPRIVLEVTADLVTEDANGNTGLRFPRCKRIRDDKFVNDINTAEDVEALK